MTRDELDEQLLRDLQRLPILRPDQARAARVRARCHAAMARGQLRRERSTRRTRLIRRGLEPALVGGLCLIYLSAVLFDVFRLHDIL